MIPDVSIFWPEKPAVAVPGYPPLIAIEILSPDDRMSEVRSKLEEHVAWRVTHVWLIDPRLRRFYVCKDALHELPSFQVPETPLEMTPADLFE